MRRPTHSVPHSPDDAFYFQFGCRNSDSGFKLLCTCRFFWKIDLYEEPGVKGNNEEPVVSRVLTIMLADEY